MGWEKACRDDLCDVLNFLLPREEQWVALTSRLRHSEKNLFSRGLKKDKLFIYRNSSEIEGCLYISKYGLLLPAFKPDFRDFSPLGSIIKKECSSPFSVMGIKDSIDKTAVLIPGSRKKTVDYYLMINENTDNLSVDTPPAEGVRRAYLSDMQKLYPLQKAYELEEVLLDPKTFEESFCRRNLTINLKKHLIYMKTQNDTAIAKAGTNAVGFEYCQLGGVFTREEYRGRGFGNEVMTALIQDLYRRNKKCSLFVKQGNEPALALYRHLGFRIIDNFRIIYYKQ